MFHGTLFSLICFSIRWILDSTAGSYFKILISPFLDDSYDVHRTDPWSLLSQFLQKWKQLYSNFDKCNKWLNEWIELTKWLRLSQMKMSALQRQRCSWNAVWFTSMHNCIRSFRSKNWIASLLTIKCDDSYHSQLIRTEAMYLLIVFMQWFSA